MPMVPRRSEIPTSGGSREMCAHRETHFVPNAPPLARCARLLTQDCGWSIHYPWVVAGVEGHLEVRSVDLDMLRADRVDPWMSTR